MKTMMTLYCRLCNGLNRYGSDAFTLFARLYVADAFLRAGLLKLSNWDTTLYLFESEYQVPLLPFELAAYLGTVAELILPILLIAGLATRLSAGALFIFNIIAVYSYPVLWEGGFYDHKLWAALLLVTVIFGQGRVSLDTWLGRKYCQ